MIRIKELELQQNCKPLQCLVINNRARVNRRFFPLDYEDKLLQLECKHGSFAQIMHIRWWL